MSEEWRAVPGWEDAYEVSDLGRVRSKDRVIWQANRWGSLSRYELKGKALKGGIDSSGYQQVNLRFQGRFRQALVHHLVLEAFGPARPAGWDADHKDGDRTYNALSNLRWASRRDQNRNRHVVRNKTGFLGVSENPRGGPNLFWASARNRDGNKVFLGMHPTAEAANAAYLAFRETQYSHA